MANTYPISDIIPTTSTTSPVNVTTTPTTDQVADIPDNILYGVYIFNGVLALLGLFGNVFVCFVIVRGHKMYNIANLFFMNLAIADIFVLGLSYPLWILQETTRNKWPFGSALCKIIFPVSDVFYGVSVGCMMAISFHRYRMIIHSMKPQMGFVTAKVLILFFYAISILTISAPIYPAMTYEKKISNGTMDTDHRRNATTTTTVGNHATEECKYDWPSSTYVRTYMSYLTLVWYLLPLLIILCHYVRIRSHLKKQMNCTWITTSLDNAAQTAHSLQLKKALRLLAPVVIVFAILMLPWNIFRVISLFRPLNTIHYVRAYLLVASTMLVANSAVNPFIYYIVSMDFRREFNRRISVASGLLLKGSVYRKQQQEQKRNERVRKSTEMIVCTDEYNNNNNNNNDNKNNNIISISHSNNIDQATPNFDEIFDNYNSNKILVYIETPPPFSQTINEKKLLDSKLSNELTVSTAVDKELYVNSYTGFVESYHYTINLDAWNHSPETVL